MYNIFRNFIYILSDSSKINVLLRYLISFHSILFYRVVQASQKLFFIDNTLFTNFSSRIYDSFCTRTLWIYSFRQINSSPLISMAFVKKNSRMIYNLVRKYAVDIWNRQFWILHGPKEENRSAPFLSLDNERVWRGSMGETRFIGTLAGPTLEIIAIR